MSTAAPMAFHRTGSGPAAAGSFEDADRLAHATFQRYAVGIPQEIDREQVLVEARRAAWEAMRSYDPRRNCRLRTHIIYRVRQEMAEECRRQAFISRGGRDLIQARLRNGEALDPWMRPARSLSGVAPGQPEDGDPVLWEDALADQSTTNDVPAAAAGRLLAQEVRRAVSWLRPNERYVIQAYDLEERGSLLAIAREMGLSQSRVNQLRNQGLGRLRQYLAALEGTP